MHQQPMHAAGHRIPPPTPPCPMYASAVCPGPVRPCIPSPLHGPVTAAAHAHAGAAARTLCRIMHGIACSVLSPVAAWPPVSRHIVFHSVVESVHRHVRSAPQHVREVARETAQVKAPAQAQPLQLSAAFTLPPIHAVLMLAAVERGLAIRCMVRVVVAAALREG